MHRIAAVSLAALIAAGAASAAPPCRDAKGHVTKCPAAPAPSARTAVVKTLAPGVGPMMAGAPRCKTGKPCGGSCVAKDKVCQK